MKKRSKKYPVEQYPFVLSYDMEDQVYIARSIDLRGCHSDGKTPQEAVKNIYEAMRGWMETAKKNHIPIPEPSCPTEKEKKFPLRIRSQNILKLKSLAAAKQESINTLINEAIASFQ